MGYTWDLVKSNFEFRDYFIQNSGFWHSQITSSENAHQSTVRKEVYKKPATVKSGKQTSKS